MYAVLWNVTVQLIHTQCSICQLQFFLFCHVFCKELSGLVWYTVQQWNLNSKWENAGICVKILIMVNAIVENVLIFTYQGLI